MDTFTPEVEAARIRTLHGYEILDTPREESLDRITQLAGRIFGVPYALISFVEEQRQWNKSMFGLALKEIPREASFCTHAIQTSEVLVVEDALQDPRFALSPLVTHDPHIRFYAGAPLISDDGHGLGVLCIADTHPRTLSPHDCQTLKDLAAVVMDALEARRSVERYRGLFVNAPDPIVIHAEEEILYANLAAARLLGAENIQPFLGASILQFIHPDDHEHVFARIQWMYETGKPAPPTEVRLLLPEDDLVHVEIHSVPTVYQGRRAVQAALRDTTERHKARQALAQSEERWRKLVEANPQPIFIHVYGRIIYANSAFAQLLKEPSPETLIGRQISDFVVPSQHDILHSRIRLLAKGQQILGGMEYQLICADGEQCLVEATGIPIVHEGQQAVQVVVRDITERKQYEAQLIQAHKEAEEMSRLKSTFLANMSHEIRTPLTTIIGFTDILSEFVTGEGEEFVEYIARSSHRLMETLNSVLDLSQIENRSFQLSYNTFDARWRVSEAVELFQNKARAQGLRLRSDIPEDPITTELDPVAFDRILNNLISNAIKFTHEGEVVVSLKNTDQFVEIQVSDTGIGISPTFLPHLFDEFRQESSGHERGYEGSGLGLAITRQLVEMMSGVIEVESEKGQGSVFTVRLPRNKPSIRSSESPSSAARPGVEAHGR